MKKNRLLLRIRKAVTGHPRKIVKIRLKHKGYCKKNSDRIFFMAILLADYS